MSGIREKIKMLQLNVANTPRLDSKRQGLRLSVISPKFRKVIVLNFLLCSAKLFERIESLRELDSRAFNIWLSKNPLVRYSSTYMKPPSGTITGSSPTSTDLSFLSWVVCRPISYHVMILSRFLALKFSNSRVNMGDSYFDGSSKYSVVCNGKTSCPSWKGLICQDLLGKSSVLAAGNTGNFCLAYLWQYYPGRVEVESFPSVIRWPLPWCTFVHVSGPPANQMNGSWTFVYWIRAERRKSVREKRCVSQANTLREHWISLGLIRGSKTFLYY